MDERAQKLVRLIDPQTEIFPCLRNREIVGARKIILLHRAYPNCMRVGQEAWIRSRPLIQDISLGSGMEEEKQRGIEGDAQAWNVMGGFVRNGGLRLLPVVGFMQSDHQGLKIRGLRGSPEMIHSLAKPSHDAGVFGQGGDL